MASQTMFPVGKRAVQNNQQKLRSGKPDMITIEDNRCETKPVDIE